MATEHAFDGVSVAIEEGGEAQLLLTIDLRRDIGERAARLDFPANAIAVVALVEKLLGGQAVRNLAAGENEGDRPAMLVS